MKAIETTAVFEGPDHLHLSEPFTEMVAGRVRVIVLWGEDTGEKTPPPNFHAAIGSSYRDHPRQPVRDSSQWLKELREGEEETQTATDSSQKTDYRHFPSQALPSVFKA